jgi:hypothetical protein
MSVSERVTLIVGTEHQSRKVEVVYLSALGCQGRGMAAIQTQLQPNRTAKLVSVAANVRIHFQTYPVFRHYMLDMRYW